MKCERCEKEEGHLDFCPETWPDWMKDHFKDSTVRSGYWEKMTQHRGMSMKVLAVANTRIEGAWCAYVDAVPGMSHEDEAAEVLAHGSKLDEDVARALFPGFRDLYYAQ